MLEILETNDFDRYYGITAIIRGDYHLSELKEGDKVKGFIAYDYHPEEVVIYAVDAENHDYNYLDGLVRSVLFKAELKGIEKAVFCEYNSTVWERLELLGFVKNDQKSIENISEFMENCKKCKENPSNT